MNTGGKPLAWLALAVRAQGYRSQACQQDLRLARDHETQARRVADAAQGEVASVLSAWQRHRAGGGAGGSLEDGYRLFHGHVHVASTRAHQAQLEAAGATGAALDALRDSFNRHHALQTLEQRGLAEVHAGRQRAEVRTVSEAWALRRVDDTKDSA